MNVPTYQINVFPKQGEALCAEYLWTYNGKEYRLLATRESDALWIELRQRENTRDEVVLMGTRVRLQYLHERERIERLLIKNHPVTHWRDLLSKLTTQFYSLKNDWREYKDQNQETPRFDLFKGCPLTMPNTVNILYGPGGIGKGLITLAMLIEYVLPDHEVFYFDWENQGTGRHFFWQRFRNICNNHQPSKENYEAYREKLRYFSGTDPIHKIVHSISHIIEKRRTEHAVLVVDSLSTALGESLNEQEPARRWMRFFNILTNEKITVWIQAHISKQDIRGGTGHAGPLGSRIFQDLSRNAWEVMPPEEKENTQTDAPLKPILKSKLVHRKSNFVPLQTMPIYFTYDQDGFTFSAMLE